MINKDHHNDHDSHNDHEDNNDYKDHNDQNDHNSPFSHRHLVCPPKFCITIASIFSWVLRSSQEKTKTMVMQRFCLFFLGGEGGEVNMVHYGLCDNGEWPQWQQWPQWSQSPQWPTVRTFLLARIFSLYFSNFLSPCFLMPDSRFNCKTKKIP